MKHEANVGGILAELLSLVGDAGRDVALYIVVVGGLTAVGVLAGFSETTAGVLNYGFSVGTDDTPASALFELFAAVVGIVAIYLLLTRLLAARGRLAAGGGRFWPYLGMAIVSTIAVVLGLFMLIIPGVVLLVRWSAASGFLIGAGEGVTDSLGASWDATEGHGWAIFFAGLIVSVGVLVGSVIIGVLLAFTSEQVVGVVSAFIEAASSALFAAFGIAIYCLVHDGGEDLSEVFA